MKSVALFCLLSALGWTASIRAEPKNVEAPAVADPPPLSGAPEDDSELAEMEAAEQAAFGSRGWPGPPAEDYRIHEGLKPLVEREGLRPEQLDFELGSGWLRHGGPRPGLSHGAETGRPASAGLDIPVEINAAVEQYLILLQGQGRKMFTRWLARTTRYYPLMRPILRKHGLPEDLVTVALIESGLKFSAFSPAKAVGPWQFMLPTGQAYGLKADFWLDERRDFLKATDAAARHLRDLFARFGDWHLAWAAYNTGETRVARALQRTGAKDYWGIRDSEYLAAETKRYVPKIIAAALISKNPERYGFADIPWQDPLTWEEVQVRGVVNLKTAARALGVGLDVLQELNPELRFWCTPPYLDAYRLRIPKGQSARFHKRYHPSPRDGQVTHTRHRLRSGETLSHVAVTYKTSVDALLSANRIKDARRIRAGRDLIVPVRPCGGPALAGGPPAQPPSSQKASEQKAGPPAARRYVVESGDTLWSIAAAHHTTVADLVKANRLKRGAVLAIGQVLTLP